MINIKTVSTMDKQAVVTLYKANGWIAYTQNPQALMTAIAHSVNIAAFDNEKLVGLLRYVTDEVSIAFIQDILILPEYQRQGIGRQLMMTAMKRLKNIGQVHLLTENEPKTVGFYTAVGFRNAANANLVTFTMENRY
ncbi:acetyltransferase GNAT family [Furfurilactobacillus rossiae]|uniref:GNAT family N-acetyltransferase n=1 Tax=Furfurilactobacillus rossiae TaxID=231049 RepID=UPI0015B7BA49|nr:GNAT family N-acetyltransferase [Furfurilactobacillus rossiae]MCF6164635.1 GNAT family N-acetyltransferase [Furfurilactobacillus rossiae]QLE64923.1 acetyltransferase GNAT family [Furfurilactobacillus rossiae]